MTLAANCGGFLKTIGFGEDVCIDSDTAGLHVGTTELRWHARNRLKALKCDDYLDKSVLPAASELMPQARVRKVLRSPI